MPTVTNDRVWSMPAPLRALAPDATDLLDAANELAWGAVPPALLEQLRLRIATLLGNVPGTQRRSAAARHAGLGESKIQQLADYHSAAAFSDVERDCIEFAEQFVIDVAGPMADYATRLTEHFPGAELNTFVGALYLIEYTQRIEMAARALLGDPADPAEPVESPAAVEALATTPVEPDAARLGAVLHEFQDAVVRLRALDPVLTELVRLRCARVHNCRVCQTLRLADARVSGADDTMTAKIDFYESSDLDDRTKTALRITDAMISGFGSIDASLGARARAVFSPSELAELILDIAKWSTQKIYVSQGTDGAEALPTNADGVSFFDFDDSGRVTGFSAVAPTT